MREETSLRREPGGLRGGNGTCWGLAPLDHQPPMLTNGRVQQQLHAGGVSRTRALICLNWLVPATSHHSNKAASVVGSVAPPESIRASAVRQSISWRLPTASTAS